jgi:single-stranded DNA-binding protein
MDSSRPMQRRKRPRPARPGSVCVLVSARMTPCNGYRSRCSAAAEAAGELKKSDRVYIEGTIKLDSWRGDGGVERHGLSVAALKCERTHNIARNRAKRDGAEPRSTSVAGGFYSDKVPF